MTVVNTDRRGSRAGWREGNGFILDYSVFSVLIAAPSKYLDGFSVRHALREGALLITAHWAPQA